jgi:hypothetical protein
VRRTIIIIIFLVFVVVMMMHSGGGLTYSVAARRIMLDEKIVAWKVIFYAKLKLKMMFINHHHNFLKNNLPLGPTATKLI